MTEPRKHHYLPQFYLRGFFKDQRSLFQIEKTTGKYYRCQIKDVAATRDFHEIDADGTLDSNAFEKILAKLEATLAEQLRTLLSEGISNGNGLRATIELLSQLRMRVPPVKNHIERSMSSNIRAVAEWLERAGQLPKPPPGLEEILRVKNLKISTKNWKCLETMFDMASDPDILNILTHMRATLYRSSEDEFFITCDQPVALLHPTVPSNSLYGIGPGTKGVEISLPLSASALLKLDHETGPHSEKNATAAEIKEFNRRTIVMAHNYVLTGNEPEFICAQSASLKTTFAGFRFDDITSGGQRFQIHRFSRSSTEEGGVSAILGRNISLPTNTEPIS